MRSRSKRTPIPNQYRPSLLSNSQALSFHGHSYLSQFRSSRKICLPALTRILNHVVDINRVTLVLIPSQVNRTTLTLLTHRILETSKAYLHVKRS